MDDPRTLPLDYEVIEQIVTAYWLACYADGACTLCGNHGVLDTTGVQTPAGQAVGRWHFCLCPNGMALRHVCGQMDETPEAYATRLGLTKEV